MKPSSALSLLLFIRLTSASPIPIVLPDCKTSACTAFISNPNTPPTKLADPHFPSHQITSSPTNTEVFDNTPVTPSSKIPAHKALAAAFPLSSSFLKSLANPASKPPQDDPITVQGAATADLPAKPTSALPELREEDARLYWASRGGASGEDADAADGVDGPKQQNHICGYTRYLQVHRTKTSKNYGDFMVVGIVLLFLAVVVALEAVEKINGVRNFFSPKPARRGEIFLGDDELVVKKPSFLQVVLPSRYTKGHVIESTEAGDVHYDIDTSNEKA